MTIKAPANRIAILLSPIFVGLAGWLADLAARYMPGHPKLDSSELTIVFVAGSTWAAGHVLLWLRGWQKHEARQEGPIAVEVSTPSAAVPAPRRRSN